MSFVLMLGACAFSPSGEPPVMPMPAHYGAQALPAQTATALGTAQTFETDTQPAAAWWQLYQSEALNALVDEGLRNSPTLAAADELLAAAHERLRGQLGDSLLPSIDAGAVALRQRALGLPNLSPNTVLYNVFAGGVQLRYTFDIFSATRLSNAALAARVDMQAYQFDAARRALAANIVSATIHIAALHRQIDITEQLVALADAQARDAARRYALGSLARADALNTRQNAASLTATLPGLHQQQAAARAALAVLLGRTPDAAPPDLDLLSLHLPANVPVLAPSSLLRSRPDIQAASAALQAAAADAGVATAQMFPSVSLSAAMGQGGFNWPAALSGAGALWSLGGMISQPIFHGGALRAARRAALHAYEAAALQYKTTVLSAFQNVADALAALQYDAQALDAASVAARDARQAFDETAARHRLGALPYASTRNSEQHYLNARLEELRFMSQRLTDTATLFLAMGAR